jgi:hypothetical protein
MFFVSQLYYEKTHDDDDMILMTMLAKEITEHATHYWPASQRRIYPHKDRNTLHNYCLTT